MKMQKLSQVRARIDKNYYYVKCLEKLIPFQKNDMDKLKLITLIGRIYAGYVTGVYSSDILEAEIIRIGKKIPFRPAEGPVRGRTLHVMTQGFAIGGHPVIVNNWIKWDKDTRSSIVFTDMPGTKIPDFLKESVKKSGGEIFCINRRKNDLSKAEELLEISQRYERVILHTHMYDVVPVLAYSNPEWKRPVYLYNHADFRFSFGFSVADCVLNMCPYDVKKAVSYRGIKPENSVWMQFPGNGQLLESTDICEKENAGNTVKTSYGMEKGAKLIVSMGSDFKYQSIIGCDFGVFVRNVLEAYEGDAYFYVIGADPSKESWKKLQAETKGRVRALGYLQREKAEELIAAADLYVVSFPMKASGATTAEMYHVPYVSLHLLSRGIENYGVSAARTIPELTEKSLEVLRGNGEKYCGHIVRNTWTEAKWRRAWKAIRERENGHRIQKITPRRFVKRQEYINCQLMQDRISSREQYEGLFPSGHTRSILMGLGKLWGME